MLIKLYELVTKSKNWKFSIAYGVLAFLVNCFASIQVYGNLTIHVGLVFVLICLITRGVKPALFAFLLSSIGLFYATGSMTLVALSFTELMVLILLYRQGMVLFFADILFWLVIGIPVTYLLLLVFYNIESADFTQIILIKQALNGLLSVSIATMLRALIPFKWYSPDKPAEPPKLSKRILELCLICIAIPSLVVMLLLSDRSADALERKLLTELELRSEHLSRGVNNYIALHLKALESFAEIINNSSTKISTDVLMGALMQQYPGFLTMIKTDQHGYVTHGSPAEKFKMMLTMPREDRDVSDRDYFTVVRDSQEAYVSNVFRGRGFGSDPIIALSTPLTEANQFKGIIEGSLSLPKFETIDDIGQDRLLLVVDSEGHVIYGSKALKLEPLDDVTIADTNLQYSDRVKSLILNEKQVFNYKSRTTDNGWEVYILSPSDELLVSYRNSFYVLFITLLLISVVASRVAHYFSLNITRPLERLVEYFSAQKEINIDGKYFLSQEVESMKEQLQRTQHVMLDFQEQLKSQVANKTKELSLLNEELKKLSSHDPLTGILNRRGFEQVVDTVFPLACRNQSNVTLAIMDLDHFKHINDKFGHNAGDACLITVAQTIEEVLQRDSDYVGRFGGEEFVALIIGESVEQHSHLLQSVRRMIEELTVEYEGDDIQFTISIGAYSLTDQFDMNYDKMLCTADKLLYESKKSGRNRMTHKSQ